MPAEAATPPRWYWAVASLLALWLMIGVASWFVDLTMSDAMVSEMSEAQRGVYARRPSWMFGLYGIAVFAGGAGGIGLLFRQRWATNALLVSLVAATLQFLITMFGPMDALAQLGPALALPIPVTVIVVGLGAVRFAQKAAVRGWLR
jgi:hypothetical protein